jgi:hypothetical protein
MANCRLCGAPAGFLLHEHKQCRERHDVAVKKIPEFFVSALQSPMSTERFRALLLADAKHNFIAEGELHRLILQGFAAMIGAATNKALLTDADAERISALQDIFGVSREELGNAGTALVKAMILGDLDAGKLDEINVSLEGTSAPRLEPGEKVIWAFSPCVHYVMKSRTTYVGSSQGVSVRLMKGVYYRVGAMRAQPVRTEYLDADGAGALTVTTRNVYFVGEHQAVKLPLRKVVAVHLYSDGVEFLPDGASKKPHIFKVDDPEFLTNLLARLGTE